MARRQESGSKQFAGLVCSRLVGRFYRSNEGYSEEL